MMIFCVGHKPPLFNPKISYTYVSTRVDMSREINTLHIPDNKFGEKFHGCILSEYTQLFGLAEFLKDSPSSEKIYIFQYRKFISLRPGVHLSSNQPYSYACSPAEGRALFPTKDDLLGVGDKLLLGPAIRLRSLAHQYSIVHLVEDFCKFILTINSLSEFDQKRCENFINCEIMIPAPSLGLTNVGLFLKHMEILRLAWEHYSTHFSISREGYQRRVGGFLLERLHSFLLCEGIKTKNYLKIQY